ncbi:MAG TPA: alpha/beta hydrolase [Vicinamibacterales bacterium]|nr:alpha/beta hydrolase [Vicinamibacterales bacterium]
MKPPNVAVIVLISAVVTACAPETTAHTGGATVWLDVAQGRLKAEVFAREKLSDRPILVLVLHGDLPNPRPDYQYLVAKAITIGWPDSPERSAALRTALGADWRDDDVVGAGLLRPGYTDPSGDQSSGDAGRAAGDNYTPAVVDAVATATRQLAGKYRARSVVMVGHSGGGAIVANILGRYPDLVDGALLVACGCDPEAWRSRMRIRQPGPLWNEANPSLLPLSTAAGIRRGTLVRLIVGAEDDVAIPADSRKYFEALQERGVDARLTIEPGLGHNILVTPASFRELGALIRGLAPAATPSHRASEPIGRTQPVEPDRP